MFRCFLLRGSFGLDRAEREKESCRAAVLLCPLFQEKLLLRPWGERGDEAVCRCCSVEGKFGLDRVERG